MNYRDTNTKSFVVGDNVKRPKGNKMFSSTHLRKAAPIIAFVFIPLIASGQDAESDNEVLEEITVVGTHIQGADIEGSLPVTVMSFEDIEATGAVTGRYPLLA